VLPFQLEKLFLLLGGKNERGKEFRQTHKEKEIDYILG
jgi:hypothetical protein